MVRPEWIEVGRVSRPHGVQGEVRILRHSDNPERFTPGSVVYARHSRPGMAGPRGSERARLTIRAVRGDEGFPIVSFEEITGRDGAEVLRGRVLEVQASELPELGEDEYYPFDLIGLQVRDMEGDIVGKVEDVAESPAHALLVVSREASSEIMVPFVTAAVPAVSVADGYLVVSGGFLDDIAARR